MPEIAKRSRVADYRRPDRVGTVQKLFRHPRPECDGVLVKWDDGPEEWLLARNMRVVTHA